MMRIQPDSPRRNWYGGTPHPPLTEMPRFTISQEVVSPPFCPKIQLSLGSSSSVSRADVCVCVCVSSPGVLTPLPSLLPPPLLVLQGVVPRYRRRGRVLSWQYQRNKGGQGEVVAVLPSEVHRADVPSLDRPTYGSSQGGRRVKWGVVQSLVQTLPDTSVASQKEGRGGMLCRQCWSGYCARGPSLLLPFSSASFSCWCRGSLSPCLFPFAGGGGAGWQPPTARVQRACRGQG